MSQEVREALGALRPALLRSARRLTPSPELAEDLVQDALERALRSERQYQPGTSVRAWVREILVNTNATRCRRAQSERRILGQLAADPCAWTRAEAAAESDHLSPAGQRALDAVAPLFRAAVVLVDLEERTYAEAARRLGVPVGTMMSRVHRGRGKLRELLQTQDA